jgi:hypothetical protein
MPLAPPGPPAAPDPARLAAIVAVGRAARRPLPRAVWIAAAVAGAVGAVGCALLLATASAPPGPDRPSAEVSARPPAAGAQGGSWLGALAGGAVVGGAVGYAVGRRSRAPGASRVQSSRRSE